MNNGKMLTKYLLGDCCNVQGSADFVSGCRRKRKVKKSVITFRSDWKIEDTSLKNRRVSVGTLRDNIRSSYSGHAKSKNHCTKSIERSQLMWCICWTWGVGLKCVEITLVSHNSVHFTPTYREIKGPTFDCSRSQCSKEKAGGKGQAVAPWKKWLVLRGRSGWIRFGVRYTCSGLPWCLCVFMCSVM